MRTDEIRDELFRCRDEAYAAFQRKLIPTVAPESILGVRTPVLRAYARQLWKRGEGEGFLGDVPHRYFDENQLHAFLLSEIRDFGRCVEGVCQFLPFVDNWATCDQLSPRVFKTHRPELLEYIQGWLGSPETYTVRFGVGMLMRHYLDGEFDPAYPAMVAAIRSEEYYVRMVVAWYFATALAKQYDAAIAYIEQRRLEPWTHNKAIQKSVESHRITPAQKAYLRSLRA